MFKVGDRVLAMWPVEMVWWYPATVVGTYGEFFDVSYDDGDQARLAASQMKALAIGVGDRVFCRWKGRNQYYPGRVASATGDAIQVQYDDGDKEDTTVRMVRIHQDDL